MSAFYLVLWYPAALIPYYWCKHMCFQHFYAIFIAPVRYMLTSSRHVQKQGIEGSVKILKHMRLHQQHMNIRQLGITATYEYNMVFTRMQDESNLR